MLFLLNDTIAEIDIPEIHLSKRWKSLGCGDPHGMRAREALEFVTRVISDHVRSVPNRKARRPILPRSGRWRPDGLFHRNGFGRDDGASVARLQYVANRIGACLVRCLQRDRRAL